jgi:hypothetical protein
LVIDDVQRARAGWYGPWIQQIAKGEVAPPYLKPIWQAAGDNAMVLMYVGE